VERLEAAFTLQGRKPAIRQGEHGRGVALRQQQRDEHLRRAVAALDAGAGLGQVLPAQQHGPLRETAVVGGETRRIV
jgi:hypothetical protein